MSDQHASASYKLNAPKGTIHRGPDLKEAMTRSDSRVYDMLAQEDHGKGKAKRSRRAWKKMKGRKA